jgi:membrane-bound lytic murein transglycosylase F
MMHALTCVALLLAAADLKDVVKTKQLRILVHGAQDYLPRRGDPRLAEQYLASELAKKLGVEPVIVPVAEQGQLIDELLAGHGDLIASSLAVTPERSAKVAFTRPVRFVRQVVVVGAGDKSLKAVDDLAGKTVTVRPSSSYAATLKGLKVAVALKPAPETEDTFSLIRQVARGEAAITVADSDIFEASQDFEPGARAAFNLTESDPIAWALRKDAPELRNAADAFLVEHALTAFKSTSYKADLDDIKKRGVLRVLTRNASTTYFVHKGEQLGFDFELVRELAKTLDVRLEMTVSASREALLSDLAEGKGDLVAAGVSITPERSKAFAFSEPYQAVSELLIVGAKDPAKGLADMKGRKISVRRSSSYFETLSRLKAQYGFEIDAAPEDVETDELIREVGEGRRPATVADSDILDVELTYSDKVKSLGPLGSPQSIAWVLRQDQPKLKAAADAFVKKTYKGLFYNVTFNKYFKDPKNMRVEAGADRSDEAGKISPYDPLIKKHAKKYELDWRLVASQMYQESRFDPHAKSWVGAQGLMQVMPATAKELKFDDVVDPDKGIAAGVMLLTRYAAKFNEPEVKEKDRIRFALAAYNCGPGHIVDARRIAKDLKLNPDKWFGNVEKALLLLEKSAYAGKAQHGFCRCSESVNYVSAIQTRYDAYSEFAPLE